MEPMIEAGTTVLFQGDSITDAGHALIAPSWLRAVKALA
jgi:hypothetical protein